LLLPASEALSGAKEVPVVDLLPAWAIAPALTAAIAAR
jgi:uncharacterized membrane protein YqgA involved in biofilm formation